MAQGTVRRSELPSDIYAVPVTVSVLVAAHGVTEADRVEDAKLEAAKWAGKAMREVGTPTKMGA